MIGRAGREGGGSSPLARGLRGAGAARGGQVADHPRSRGVYRRIHWLALAVKGSSPLARGLRAAIGTMVTQPGIIPARAGFTRRRWRHCPAGRDHPRSRGVYPPEPRGQREARGSSPLARGLRVSCFVFRVRVWIIPARAGFTRGARPRRRYSRDHPRSRGVYALRLLRPGGGAGSSPLARGLLGAVENLIRIPGIIPARAGFTRDRQLGACRHTDHPRSRGVYDGGMNTVGGKAGSSPLARGLPVFVGMPRLRGGIIPARAGFTRFVSSRFAFRVDHPRSRGVYTAAAESSLSSTGSSPLARGLRDPPLCRRRPQGIIPARAGFTAAGAARTGPRSDHPRSRGVYPPA